MRDTRTAILLALTCAGLAACDARKVEGGGGSSDPTSGAHTVHLAGTLARGLSCVDCHNSQFQVTFPPKVPPDVALARANGAQPSFNSTNLTCSNVYCHDGGPQLVLGGGTVPTPAWNPPSVVACGACHALPGGAIPTPWHPQVAAGVQCALCHPGYTNTTVNRDLHVNGVVNLTQPNLATSCTACHGDPTRVVAPGDELLEAAPPRDRNGGVATTLVGVGAHQAHLAPPAGAISSPIACNECHAVPGTVPGVGPLAHVGPMAGTAASLDWGSLASAGGATPGFNAANATCTNYCHGQTLTPMGGAGTNTTPIWTQVDGTQASCGSCHGSPPGDLAHVLHTSPTTSVHLACNVCHPPGYSNGAVGPAAVPVHVNGTINLNVTQLTPDFRNWDPNAVGPTLWSGTATGCHDRGRYWKAGPPGSGCF